MDRKILSLILLFLITLAATHGASLLTAFADNDTGHNGLVVFNGNITAVLYSDGYVRVNASLPVKEGESPGSFRVLSNYTFYDDKTVKDIHLMETRIPFPPGSTNQYLEQRLTGKRDQGNLVGTANITIVSKSTRNIYTNVMMKYNASYHSHSWILKARFIITTNNTLFENELANITPQEFFPVQGAEIVSFNSNFSDNYFKANLTAILPYKPSLTTYSSYMSGYVSVISFLSENRTLEINYYGYVSPSSVNIKQHIVYKGGFSDHIESFIKKMRQAFQREAAKSGSPTLNTNETMMIDALEQLARNYEVKNGSIYTQLMTPTANIIITPLIREKGVNDPIKTLVGLRNILLQLSKTNFGGFNTTQVLNQKITLKPGDRGIKKIQPNQTILGNLESVKVNPEAKGINQTFIGGIIAIIVAIAITAIYILRK